ncbi:TadE/TadG family type IV pilus assembly protein [Aliamphritea hakodatensis]|uniref:TadE/TadG family type IV pilus assembly protein n=1 Tax=Aliamphritea hakodatensis TaxID=2895352 RepID=UPI0022FD8BA2|nr:TadE/TadG family type IV pilus assembly protein [Aliamphritea hakodatensis]
MNTCSKHRTRARSAVTGAKQQRGIVTVVVAVGLIALVAMVGLALDTGHLLLNKTRLQNAVDAAALSGARTLQLSVSAAPMDDARAAAIATFNANLSDELTSHAPVPTVTFSEDLTPGSFVAATAGEPNYIKVATPLVPLTSYLVQVVGVDDKPVGATAVAGFGSGASVCDLIPVMVCKGTQDPDTPTGFSEFDFSAGLSAPFDPATDTVTLKTGSGSGPDTDVGTGSFHLIDIPGLQGANDIRYAFAESSNCGDEGQEFEIDLAPGNKVGPTVQGINTRFGLYSGPLNGNSSDYPPDYANDTSHTPDCIGMDPDGLGSDPDNGTGPNACLDPRNYANYYNSPSSNIQPEDPRYQRRMVKVPVGACDGSATGNDTVETLGFGCFLLTDPATQQGGANSDSGSLRGVFMHECTPPATGVTQGSGVTTIFLFKNPDGEES